jgi:hypothetical protein
MWDSERCGVAGLGIFEAEREQGIKNGRRQGIGRERQEAGNREGEGGGRE